MERPQMYQGRLKEKILLAEDTYDFVIECDQAVPFKAGQFMNVTIKDGQEPVIRRAYSICSAPYDNKNLSLCIKIVEGGRATTWFKSLEPGSEIEFMAPLGHFTFKEDSPNEALFIATGTGLAPLNSMITEQLSKGDTRKMTLLFGLRHIANMFYDEKNTELMKKHPNFKYVCTLSRPESESWTREKGRVTDWLRENFAANFNKDQVDIYICGLGDMVQEVQSILTEQGVAKENIHFERYS